MQRNSENLFNCAYNNKYFEDNLCLKLQRGKSYVVHADIAKCYGSIYSHSIAWAIKGKLVSKNDRNPKLWFNQLDQNVRSCHYGETNGVMIGPYAMQFVVEIILVKIDSVLSKKWSYIRYIDDYLCYVDSQDQATEFLIDLAAELRKYNLSLNEQKTDINALPSNLHTEWVRELTQRMKLYKGKVLRSKDIVDVFDYTINLIHKNNDNMAIMNYLLNILEGFDFDENGKEIYKLEITNLALCYSYLIPLLDRFLLNKDYLNENEIEELLNDLYNVELSKKHYDMFIYIFYYAIKFNSTINFNIKEDILCLDSPLVKVVVYQYLKRKNNTQNMHLFKEDAKKLGMIYFDSNWIYIYEVLNLEELKEVNNNLKENSKKDNIDEWIGLKKEGVSFIQFQVM